MLHLYHGDNYFESWREALKTAGEFTLLDGSNLDSLDKIFLNTGSYSLFGETPVLLVKRFASNKKRTLLDDFVNEIAKLGNLQDIKLIFWEDKTIDKRTRFFNYFKKSKTLFEFQPLKTFELNKWLATEARQEEITIPSALAERLITLSGTDQHILYNELQKLILLVRSENRNEIVFKDLEVVSVHLAEGNIWDLMDAISQKNVTQMLAIIEIFLQDRNQFPLVMAMIAKQIKLLYLLKAGANETELTAKLKIHPFTISKARNHLYKFDLNRLKIMFNKLANLDMAIKQGKIEPMLGLNLFLASV